MELEVVVFVFSYVSFSFFLDVVQLRVVRIDSVCNSVHEYGMQWTVFFFLLDMDRRRRRLCAQLYDLQKLLDPIDIVLLYYGNDDDLIQLSKVLF